MDCAYTKKIKGYRESISVRCIQAYCHEMFELYWYDIILNQYLRDLLSSLPDHTIIFKHKIDSSTNLHNYHHSYKLMRSPVTEVDWNWITEEDPIAVEYREELYAILDVGSIKKFAIEESNRLNTIRYS